MELLFSIYLIVGLTSAGVRLLRDRKQLLQKREVTILKKNGNRVTKETRGATEYFLTLVFDVLLWWVPLVFWAVYAPWHDRRAEKAYLEELVQDDTLWVPPRLEDEVARLRRERLAH